jgi:hypothetical protein
MGRLQFMIPVYETTALYYSTYRVGLDVFVPNFSIYPAGLLSLAVGHPFDTIKVRLQTMRPTDCLVTGGSLQVKDSNLPKD